MAQIRPYTIGGGKTRYQVRSADKRTSKSFSLKKDAERFRNELERQEQLGPLYEAPDVTLGDFYDGWIERYKARVRPSTYQRTLDLNGHLKRWFDYSLKNLPANKIEDYVLKLSKDSPRQAELVLSRLKGILKDAQARGQRVNESILGISPPRYESRSKRFLTPEEVEKLALAVPDHVADLIRLAALTGLRQGELFGLLDRNVQLGSKRVLVMHSVYKSKLVPPKTKASKRVVELSPQAVEILQRQLERRTPNQRGLVFPTKNGLVWNANNFNNRIFQPAVQRAGLAPLTFHDLRHTYAALMIRAGAHPKWLQSQMGHSSITVTMDTYGHLFPFAGQEVMDRFTEVWG